MRLSIALIALGLVAAPASAEEMTLRVAYDDLDLTSEYELAALKSRIADAAAAACAPAKEWVLSTNTVATCKTTLTRKALAEVEVRRAETAQP
jgi:UrcA family protein